MVNLTGKVAVVTGASRGIGRGIALVLAEEGATVYVTGRTMNPGDYGLGNAIKRDDVAGALIAGARTISAEIGSNAT